MNDSLRHDQHHGKRRHRDGAHGEGRPIGHDADQHHRRHNVRALRRHLGAGEDQIEGRGGERRHRRPFLDGVAQGQRWKQRKHGAHDEEHHARDERHVIAGDRQHMPDARNVHGVEHRRRQRIALAGDQGRCDRPGIAFHRRADAAVNPVADRLDGGCKGEPQPQRGGRRQHIDPSQREAGSADPLKIKIASKIITTGTKRRRRRIEPCLQRNKRPDRGRGALAHRQADALGLLSETRGLHGGDVHHDAI